MIIELLASLPPIQSALSYGSDGCRVKLDIPETHIAEAAKLIMLRGKEFKVRIEVV